MTVIFVTAHDVATQSNLIVAQNMSATADLSLFAQDATRAQLYGSLNPQTDRTIFVMTHGGKNAVFDNNCMPAIDAADGDALSGYKIFAWACHTGASLGFSMAQQGVTWWGYDCAVTAPDGRASFAGIFAQIFATAKSQFPKGIDPSSIAAVLEEIRLACEVALLQFDQLGAQDDDESFSLYSCCNQLWQRLSVWLSGQNKPNRHVLAPPAYIDI